MAQTTYALPQEVCAMASALLVAREHSTESFRALMEAGWMMLDSECSSEELDEAIERAIDDDDHVRDAVMAWLRSI